MLSNESTLKLVNLLYLLFQITIPYQYFCKRNNCDLWWIFYSLCIRFSPILNTRFEFHASDWEHDHYDHKFQSKRGWMINRHRMKNLPFFSAAWPQRWERRIAESLLRDHGLPGISYFWCLYAWIRGLTRVMEKRRGARMCLHLWIGLCWKN